MFSSRSSRRPALLSLAAVAAGSLLLSACSSSGSNGANASSTTSNSPGSSAAGSAATAAVQKYLKVPTSIDQTTPLKSKPATGKLIMMVGGNLPANTAVFNGLQAAAASIGWRAQRVTGYTEGNPASYIAALDTALQSKPAGVVMDGGLPEAAWASVIPKYRAAGVAMIPIYAGPLTQPLGNPVIANLGSPSDIGAVGNVISSWVASDAGGQPKKVLLFNLPDIPVLSSFAGEFRSTLKKSCSGCSVTTIDGTLTQLDSGTIIPPIVSALQRGKYDYFVSADGEITNALPSALRTAGISGVKIASEACDAINERNLLAGQESACTGSAYTVGGWLAMDVLLRHLEGMTVPADGGGLPTQLLTKANASTWQAGESDDIPPNYADQFKKLWHVG
jgi:ABC-type sugar transport system substrate-binding protein